MLGPGSNNGKNPKKSFMKNAYDEIEERDYRELLDAKDLQIRGLQYKIQKLETQYHESVNRNTGGGEEDNYFKQKLAQAIKANEMVFNILLTLGHKLKQIITMLKESAGFNEDSTELKKILNILGSNNESSLLSSDLEDNSDDDDDSIDNIQSINKEVSKVTEELSAICSAFHKNYLQMQKEVVSLDVRMKEERKISQQQISNLNKDLERKVKNGEKLQQLFQKSQTARNYLVNQISACLTNDYKKQLQSMDKPGLINEIRRLMFKIKELESAKSQVVKQSLKSKTGELQKYRKMLLELKQVKEMSSMSQSRY